MTLRLFAAIPVPDILHAEIRRLQKGVPGARWRPHENFHITLRYFGELDERRAEDLDAELANIAMPPFELSLLGSGWFGKLDPRALWLGVRPSAALSELNARCERAARKAGLAPEHRKFHPHMTLAYLQGTPIDKLTRFAERTGGFATEPWRVTHFTMYSSWTSRGDANIYEPEADYPLL
ncbi:RNA 2',3'-cyclic phosphodiesterase [Maricaulis sp.]|uniref:RNA 2',3'-cyclic phosphodiesterase n=1 Tax=Maricaulis sp. TaxID=1486257 RepID=UPI0025C65D8F|nr:RNA 2',3'-cyclic phosphodiesterase [Maricaulis sp.]